MAQSRWWIVAILGALLVSGFSPRAAFSANPKSKSSPSKSHSRRTKLIRKEYAIAELIDAQAVHGPETLVKAIVRAVKPKSWKKKGGSATIKYRAKKKVLVVKQTIEGHQQIGCILKALSNICREEQRAIVAKPKGKEPAECKRLAAKVGKTEVKIVLWTYMAVDVREEFIQADHYLAVKLAEKIARLSKKNGEKVTIVKPDLVKQYKSRHPNWEALDPEKIGHDFNADYVIYLDIDKLSLYEPNSNQQFFRGQTHILVSVRDTQHPDEETHREFIDRFPRETVGAISTFDLPPIAFREKFLQHVAKRLARYFVDH